MISPTPVMLTLALVVSACAVEDQPTDRPQVCVDDGHSSGPPCVQLIANTAAFDAISISIPTPQHARRLTKFIAPASTDPELLPLVVQNASRYTLHIEFLRATFPDLFPDFGQADYQVQMLRRATRRYFTGNLVRFEHPDKGDFYGFTLYTASGRAEQLEPAEVRHVYEQLREALPDAELAYTFEPFDAAGPKAARNWVSPGFPVYFLDNSDVSVEVYTAAIGYGRVRRFTLAQLDAAIRAGTVSWQDIVVVDEVPFDIETVVAGVVTGGRQWELSHVNVRMARRGTPNVYVADCLKELASYEGKLVKLQTTRTSASTEPDSYTITEATTTEAEAYWTAHRPDLPDPSLDVDYAALASITELDPADELLARVGGKAANLAGLYKILPQQYQAAAFAIPFSHFEQFMNDNTIIDRRVSPPEKVSYRVYVTRLAADERVRTDAAYRHALLWDLRERMYAEGQVDSTLVSALANRVKEEFGNTAVKVRFRSSSNVEDILEFSGAGLYSSTSVCAADSLDDDRDGPSRCDLSQDEERTIERGLKKVWASLYASRAWDERDWYQIGQVKASMAVLVSFSFTNERANGVAFTGNPSANDDSRYLINAQVGDESVVGNTAGIVPEKSFLTLADTGGEVAKIDRVRSSALALPGVRVLTDEQLELIGSVMADIADKLSIDIGDYDADQVLLDMEFKIDSTGKLKFKQIRPFLRPEVQQ